MLLSIALRTVFFYLVVLVMMRLMGKREIGNLSPFDLVVSIMIAELAALPIENTEKPLLEGVIPLLVLLTAEVVLAYFSLKNEKFRSLVNGTPSVVVAKGKIMEQEMRRLRYNINDLMTGLRSNGIVDVADVEYAVLETSGTLSVLPMASKRPLTPGDVGVNVAYEGLPLPLITDGRIHWDMLERLHWGKEELDGVLRENNILEPAMVLFAYVDSHGQFQYQNKEL